MSWKEVCVEVNTQAVEPVSNIMNELGSGGVITGNIADRTKIIAYYNNDKKFPELLAKLKLRINNLSDYNIDTGKVSFSVKNRNNEDWATNWHKYFKPLKIGKKFIISPSWENVADSKRQIIKIDPGMAFGIGSHETTQMCVELLEKYIVSENLPLTMLDIGTGTGILSIVAAYLGVKRIVSIDIDPAAVDAARENIKINQVEEYVKIIKGDMTKDIEGKFSLITANLLPDLILRLLPSVPSLMDLDTNLILSGIIKEKRDNIVTKLEELDLQLIEEITVNDWVSLVVTKE